jgi:hypothetical protein
MFYFKGLLAEQGHFPTQVRLAMLRQKSCRADRLQPIPPGTTARILTRYPAIRLQGFSGVRTSWVA